VTFHTTPSSPQSIKTPLTPRTGPTYSLFNPCLRPQTHCDWLQSIADCTSVKYANRKLSNVKRCRCCIAISQTKLPACRAVIKTLINLQPWHSTAENLSHRWLKRGYMMVHLWCTFRDVVYIIRFGQRYKSRYMYPIAKLFVPPKIYMGDEFEEL